MVPFQQQRQHVDGLKRREYEAIEDKTQNSQGKYRTLQYSFEHAFGQMQTRYRLKINVPRALVKNPIIHTLCIPKYSWIKILNTSSDNLTHQIEGHHLGCAERARDRLRELQQESLATLDLHVRKTQI